ncbi:hypothetical protein [Paenibacillus xylanexedens]|uniref:hypothetical protein n=1 Tax=Paenibacillus xylanexedens TaxID=528191 RepID=UPI0011A65870|nr:hypothetical protein [Paenibacillus xylanexedens]
MTVVGILGVVHDDELRIRHHLTLDIIKELILDFDPDVICGEVLPTSFEKYTINPAEKGYWGEPPSEYYDLIFPLCEEQNYTFVPIDWVELDVWNDFDPLRNYTDSQKEELEHEFENWWQKQLAASSQGAIPFNNKAFDDVTKLKYHWIAQLDTRSHAVRWECRHELMLQRIKNAIKDNANARILCIVGADHNHALYEGLQSVHNIQIRYPLK